MADSVSDLNPQQLIQQLRSRGVSIPEISRVLGRNSRMIYKVFRGESKGDLYKPALEDLARDGWTDKIPPRRRSKNGELVKVRAPHGAPEATITPVDKGGRYAAGKQGGRFREDTAFGPNGRRRHQLHIPKKGKVGRAQANDELLRLARSAARGQSKDTQKRVNVELTFANGRRMSLRDYNASTLLDRFQHQGGGDPLSWLTEQALDRYPNLDVTKEPITGISLTVVNTPRTEHSSRTYQPKGSQQ